MCGKYNGVGAWAYVPLVYIYIYIYIFHCFSNCQNHTFLKLPTDSFNLGFTGWIYDCHVFGVW
jgi:hypothetical protein